MVCGLFSSFDPSLLSSGKPLKWIFLATVLLTLNYQIYAIPTGLGMFWKLLAIFLMDLTKQSGIKSAKSVMIMVFSGFIFISSLNIIGLIPLGFSFTSQVSVNLSVALPMWLAGVILGLKKSSDHFFSHFLPMGSPMFLWPMMVFVESVSLLVRPVALAIRLMANVMAGHLILSLVGTLVARVEWFWAIFPFIFECGFLMFEVCIALVQAYVFMTLLVLYWAEA